MSQLDIIVAIDIELWRLIVMIVSFAGIWFILGILASKWKNRTEQNKYMAGELIVMLDTTDEEPNTFLKLTRPLGDIVNKPVASFKVKWDTRGHMYESKLEQETRNAR